MKENFHKQEREREREREGERECVCVKERDALDTYSLMLRQFEKLCENLQDLTNF